METTNKAIVQITISDDEDEENTRPSKSKLPSKVKKETENNVQKAVISIIIPDEEEDENPLRKEPKHASAINEQETNCHVSSSIQSATSPGKKLKVNIESIKKLKAMVKLKKLDLGSREIVNGNISSVKSENNHFQPQHEPSASSSTLQVKMAENKNKGNSKQPPNPEIGIFESVEKRFSPENKDTMDKKTLLVNKSSTSGIKRSKSPPLSSSLRQSKLSEESFSPKKKPTTMNRCLRQELPLHYDAPLYCSVQLRKSLLNPDPKIKDFTENQMNSLQALKEEDFHQAYLNTVMSFMSQCRKPPPALVFYMLHSILLEKQSSCATECSRILRQIQVLHPAVPARMVAQKITWEYINSMIVKMSADSCLAVNASMALSFLISVMEEEVDMKKTFSLVKTSAYRLLSVTHFTRICDVIQWIGQAIEQHASQCSHGCGHNICPVHLLQRMLMLSLSISERPEDCASRIADELFLVYNWQLLSIEHKTLLLQSMKSHLLRIKLIEVILSNCCPSQVEQENVKIPMRSGLRHIIFFDFMRSPPIYDAECAYTTVSCEEFIMLLAYFLQSFIFCRKRSLRKNTSDSLRIMSMDDGEVLLELDKEVLKLRERLESFCSPSPLSSRSYQLLDLMLSLKSFAKKLP